MEKLTGFKAGDSQITDLTGLEYATNLETLRLWVNPLSDLSPIANLTKLKALDLGHCPISNLSPLANLTRLVELQLNNNRISDITPLAHLTKLEVLELHHNRITDIAPLANLMLLTELRLNENEVGNVEPLANLAQLTKLRLHSNQIEDINPLAHLTRLEVLELHRNRITDIAPFTNLTTLTHLILSDNRISDIIPLAHLTRLEVLHLERNRITDIAPLANLVLLTELRLNENEVGNVEPLANLAQLTKLRLHNNRIEDINPIVNLINLRHLELQNNRIIDIAPLANLTNLEYLDTENNPIFDPNSPLVEIPDPNLRQAVRDALNLPLDAPITQASMGQLTGFKAGDSQITDLTGLEYATNLETLRLWGNPLSDLSPIANLTKLKTLDLGHCQISNLSPLANLTRLVELQLNNNRISDITPLAHLTRLEMLHLDRNRITDIAPLANLVLLTELRLNENEVGNVKPLANLTQLTELHLFNNRTEDIRPLANLRQLTILDLRTNQIVDITPLADLRQLTKLDLRVNEIMDIRPLANLGNLRELELLDNRIIDIAPLANLKQLTKLDLRRNYIMDITALAELTQLRVLYLTSNKITDVGPLASLTALDKLHIESNLINDHSPLDGLSLIDFRYDQFCEMPPLPLEPRLENRTYPSAFGAHWIFGDDSRIDLLYSINWGVYLRDDGRMAGDLEYAIQKRDELMAMNPNMVFLVQIKMRAANIKERGEHWPYWVRDGAGNIAKDPEDDLHGLMNFTHPAMQDLIVEQAVAAAKCGLFDGVVFDSYRDFSPVLPFHLVDLETQQKARAAILKRIRARTRANFLIQVNSNWFKIPLTGPYINGLSMETGVPKWNFEEGYGDVGLTLQKVADTLLWAEEHLREPHINGVAGEALSLPEPADGPENRRWVRVLTTLSMTHADGGYVTYQVHGWYDFLEADIGRPVGPKAQLYDEDISGLYIREYTKGWAVYNNSGEPQVITLPEETQGVASGLVKTEHSLPNLDGEMYLRVKPKNPADVNRDGTVNILDLVVVAANLSQTGENDADVNRDGVVNILDLVLVAGALGGGGAAPSAYSLDPSMINAADIASWLALAQGLGVGDANFQQGIRFLQQLLAALTPKETALLPNYPNPFNPETWIPYRLAQEAEVTITIYDTTGTPVRRLAIGNQAAGYYAERGKAAYWDGRNEREEAVASGIYFYQFRAGDYVASRRMVILK